MYPYTKVSIKYWLCMNILYMPIRKKISKKFVVFMNRSNALLTQENYSC